ncbi:transposase [Defluviimonas sp. D31]|uniref:transposase n=1 Tax=Defluviimonas sp. D31 TaxID=3083253 RepID=UPI00296FCC4B|nr:transposase [Defluviimonas sp. D31]MDW4550690.1 transposase [Defluviimonas sp. D31]
MPEARRGPPSPLTSTIAADPRLLGAVVGMTRAMHSWGSALTHHPHVHMMVPGGLSPECRRWLACHHGFFRCSRVFSRLSRWLFL